ncbi:hypothetical protein OAN24_01585 [Pseudodesulfovibrio sp.]|nr:hypothetical protein [Pseudodesulfovibrio sp.]
MTKKVIIYGTGSGGMLSAAYMRRVGFDVIAYTDRCEQSSFMGKPFIWRDHLHEMNYDYLCVESGCSEEVFSDLKRLGVPDIKIFSFEFFRKYNAFNLIDLQFEIFAPIASQIEILFAGLSYTLHSIVFGQVEKNSFCQAQHGQDIYYTFQLLKYSLENYNCGKLRHFVYMPAPYILHYDLTLSGAQWRDTSKYINKFGTHNLSEERIEYLRDACTIYGEQDPLDIFRFLYQMQNNCHLNSWDTTIDTQETKIQCTDDYRKGYPATVRHNTELLQQMLALLAKHDIEAHFITPPASKEYRKHIARPQLVEEYNDTMSDLQQEFDFHYYDYFETDLFDESDFYLMGSHFNRKGATRFTAMVNDFCT